MTRVLDRGTRTLVTGAAGFIGSHLVERLLEDGAVVVGVDRLSDYYDVDAKLANLAGANEHPDFTFVEADVGEIASPYLLEGFDVVFHLAGQPGVRPSWGQSFQIYLDDNVRATQALLEAARNSSLRSFVLASSSSVYGDAERFPTREDDLPHPVSPYGVTKLAAEHLCRLYCRQFAVPAVLLRYFSVYGPRQRPDMAFSRFIRAAESGAPIRIFGDGRQSRDFTYVADIVDATIAAAERGTPGEVYNVAGGSSTSLLDVLSVVERLVGRPLATIREPAAPGDARDTGADITKARRELGYAPGHSLESGLLAQVEAALSVARS